MTSSSSSPPSSPASTPSIATNPDDAPFWHALLADLESLPPHPRYIRAASAILSHPCAPAVVCSISTAAGSRLHALLSECPQYTVNKPTPISNLYAHFISDEVRDRYSRARGALCAEAVHQLPSPLQNQESAARPLGHPPVPADMAHANPADPYPHPGPDPPSRQEPVLRDHARLSSPPAPSDHHHRLQSHLPHMHYFRRATGRNDPGRGKTAEEVVSSELVNALDAAVAARAPPPRDNQFEVERRKLYSDAISQGAVGSTLVFGFAVSSLIDSMQTLPVESKTSGYVVAYFVCMCSAVGITGLSTLLSSGVAVRLNRTLAVLGREMEMERHEKEAKWDRTMLLTKRVAPLLLVAPFLGLGCVMAAIVCLALRLVAQSIAISFAGILGFCFVSTVLLAFYLRLHSVIRIKDYARDDKVSYAL